MLARLAPHTHTSTHSHTVEHVCLARLAGSRLVLKPLFILLTLINYRAGANGRIYLEATGRLAGIAIALTLVVGNDIRILLVVHLLGVAQWQ